MPRYMLLYAKDICYSMSKTYATVCQTHVTVCQKHVRACKICYSIPYTKDICNSMPDTCYSMPETC